MSLSVLAGLAGALFAAAATGLLARECVRRPQAGIVLWAAGCLALVLALLAQIAGFATGFTPVTFRAVQLGAQFAAVLWLAWGLVEVAPFGGTTRFSVRLASAAITVVGGVMVGSDSLTAAPFTKSWPAASAHFQFIASDVLLLTQGVAVLVALTAAGAASLRARAGSDSTGSGQEVPGYAAAVAAVLVTASLRFAFPVNSSYPLLCGLSAALAWFAMTRVRGARSELSAAARGQRARRYESDDPANVSRYEPTVRGLRGRNRDDWDEPRRGRGRRDDQEWYEPGADDRGYPGEEYQGRGYDESGYGFGSDARSAYQQPVNGGYGPNGYDQGSGYGAGDYGQAGYAPGGHGGGGYEGANGGNGYGGNGYGGTGYGGANGGNGYGGGGYEGANGGNGYGGGGYEGANGGNGYGETGYGGANGGNGYGGTGYGGANGRNGYGETGYGGANGGNGYGGNGYGGTGYGGANGGNGYGGTGYGGTSSGNGAPGYGTAGYERPNGASYSGPPDAGKAYGRAAQPEAPVTAVSPAQVPATTPAGRPYGRISIFTLLDDKAAEFDLLAEQTAEAVRVAEPDTLVYVIHLVPKAPMQRIFYEIYRDRDAFDLHERQPHNQRFAAERRPYVLATNIIELRLKYAKVAPLSPGASQKSQTQRNAQTPQTPQGQLPSPDPASRPSAPNRSQPSPMGQRYGG